MKRSIIIKFKDGSEKELELEKDTMIKSENEITELTKLKSGKWRLIWTEGLIDDFSEVIGFDIKRED